MRITATILVLLAFVYAQAEWTISLYVGNPSLPGYEDTFFIGVRHGATSGYDFGIDVSAGMPPPSGFFPYLAIYDTMFPGLTTLLCDYRDLNETYHLWEFVVRGNEGDSFTLRFDSHSYPYPCDTPIFLRYIASEDTPSVSDWDVAPCLTSSSDIGTFPVRKHIFIQYIDLNYVSEPNKKPGGAQIEVYACLFGERCVISVENLEKPDYVKIYDFMGRKIDEFFVDAGDNNFVWSSYDVKPGVYLVSIGRAKTKVVVIR